VGEFDEINAPIAHSDLDLCFKVREAGLRCVYTPFATLTHRGHVSIGAKAQEKTDRADKSSVFLLQRWAHFTCRDPFFTDNMRDWLYHDSPTPVRMFAAKNSATGSWTRDILLVSHELSLSGAPIILAHLAKWCRANGIFVVVMSPVDGPLRETFLEADIPLIVDPLLATGYEMFTKFGRGFPVRSHQSFIKFARGFDRIVASTIFAAPLIRDAQIANVPSVWWIHEGLVGDHFLKKYPRLGNIFEMADIIATPNEESRRIYQPFTSRRILPWPYGIPDVPVAMSAIQSERKRVRFLLLGTVEPRKGQQTFVRAVRELPRDVREGSEFLIVGRPHDAHLAEEVRAAAKSVSHLHYKESIPHANAMELIRGADVMVCTSCDETGPLTLIEGMALGKPILSTPVGLVAEKLVAGTEGLFVKSGDVEELLEAIVRLVREPELRRRLAINSRRAYEKHFTLDRFAKDFVALIDKADPAEAGNVRADVMTEALSSQ
jgi:glycosyltransferase involved in cell wall biosynthesis